LARVFALFALFAPFSLAALPPAPARAQGSAGALQAALAGQLARAGGASSAYVYDLSAAQPLFSQRAGVLRPPASVEKLYTATAALQLMGAQARLHTSVLGSGQLAPGGVWEGDLYLRGGGDPTFGSTAFIRAHYGGVGARVSELAAQLVQLDGIHHITGSIQGDESILNNARGEPASGFAPDPFLEGTLSGLAFNRGESGSQGGPHAPAVFAAHALRAALKHDGVSSRGPSGSATTPPGATPLAQVASPTLARLLALMLPPSDNFFAEMLIKDLGATYGGAGSTGAGAVVASQTIASLLGIHPRIVDGSGLSRADRTSASQIATLLIALAPTPAGALLRGALAIAGRSGTLAHRMKRSPAAGRCQGKTGTLIGVSNLVGYCSSQGGHLLAFAIFIDGISIELAHTIQDRMAASIAAY
jgi:D-alanyl-D-alanine carboxypeptidase/D-alanyl-D-alanine-endopeptidase (penicillin-binding protein 4)